MKTITTELGRNKIREAILNQQELEFSEIALGDGAGDEVHPDPAETELRNEVFRAPITSLMPIHGGQLVHASLLVPANAGGFMIREARLDLADGTMVAFSGGLLIDKPVGAGVLRLNIIVNMETEIGVPSVIAIIGGDATQEWVYQNFALADALAELDARKLDATAYIQYWKGLHYTLEALQAAHPVGAPGWYATVDAGIGADPVTYLWDASDAEWKAGGGGTGVTPEQVQTLIENHAAPLEWDIPASATVEPLTALQGIDLPPEIQLPLLQTIEGLTVTLDGPGIMAAAVGVVPSTGKYWVAYNIQDIFESDDEIMFQAGIFSNDFASTVGVGITAFTADTDRLIFLPDPNEPWSYISLTHPIIVLEVDIDSGEVRVIANNGAVDFIAAAAPAPFDIAGCLMGFLSMALDDPAPYSITAVVDDTQIGDIETDATPWESIVYHLPEGAQNGKWLKVTAPGRVGAFDLSVGEVVLVLDAAAGQIEPLRTRTQAGTAQPLFASDISNDSPAPGDTLADAVGFVADAVADAQEVATEAMGVATTTQGSVGYFAAAISGIHEVSRSGPMSYGVRPKAGYSAGWGSVSNTVHGKLTDNRVFYASGNRFCVDERPSKGAPFTALAALYPSPFIPSACAMGVDRIAAYTADNELVMLEIDGSEIVQVGYSLSLPTEPSSTQHQTLVSLGNNKVAHLDGGSTERTIRVYEFDGTGWTYEEGTDTPTSAIALATIYGSPTRALALLPDSKIRLLQYNQGLPLSGFLNQEFHVETLTTDIRQIHVDSGSPVMTILAFTFYYEYHLIRWDMNTGLVKVIFSSDQLSSNPNILLTSSEGLMSVAGLWHEREIGFRLLPYAADPEPVDGSSIETLASSFNDLRDWLVALRNELVEAGVMHPEN